MLNIARKLFGSSNDREIKRMRPIVDQINALEPDFVELDDAALAQKTVEFRERHENGDQRERRALFGSDPSEHRRPQSRLAASLRPSEDPPFDLDSFPVKF